MDRPGPGRLADAASVVAVAALGSVLLDRAGVPSAALFGGLLAVQVLRLFVMLLSAPPPVARRLGRREG